MTRRGFTLVEVMVAMVLLAVVVVSVARGASSLALAGHTNDLKAKRTASLLAEVNKMGTVPFSLLSAWSTHDTTFTKGDFGYTRKLTITSQNASNTRYQIKVVIVPSSDATKKDSVIFDRTQPPTTSPLCVGC